MSGRPPCAGCGCPADAHDRVVTRETVTSEAHGLLSARVIKVEYPCTRAVCGCKDIS